MQNDFNKFITEKSFNLYRDDIGSNKENKNTLKIIENSKNGIKNIEKNDNNKEILNPVKRKFCGYKKDDVFRIIKYTRSLEHKILILTTDNSNKELLKRNRIIKEQKSTIQDQK